MPEKKLAPFERLERILFVPDSHFPFQDKRAWGLMLTAMRHFKPETIIVLGDFFDFWAVSAHSKDPRRRQCLKEEIAGGNEGLKDLESLKPKKKTFMAGNHEHRLDRYIEDKAQDVYRMLAPAGLLSVHSLPAALDFQSRGWNWVPYKSHLKLGANTFISHDIGKAGANAHIDAENTFQGNAIIGHTHRMAYNVRGTVRECTSVGAMFGWLGDRSNVDYMHKARALRDWALGFGIGFMDHHGRVFIQPVPIIDYRCVVSGVQFSG